MDVLANTLATLSKSRTRSRGSVEESCLRILQMVAINSDSLEEKTLEGEKELIIFSKPSLMN